MQIVLMIVVAIFVFGAVIFFHELGHFVAAKRSGIKVNEFALGMGPTLFKIQRGETKYALRLLPIGGFVSMEGEDEESEDTRSFQQAAIWKRIIVTCAGAFMNLVLGFLALVVIVAATQGPIVGMEIARVTSDSTGLQKGDILYRINGRRAFIFSDLEYEFLRSENGAIDITVKRDGKKVELRGVTFDMKTAVDEETGDPIINKATGEPYEYMDLGFKVRAVEKNVFTVVKEAFLTTLSYTRIIYLSLFDLLTGRVPINQLSGPVGIVTEIGRAVTYGWRSVVQLLAIISVNLGVMNMLPLPALDGGRTLLLIIEAIRRKPLKQKYEIAINVAGFALLMGLMIFVSINDIRNLIVQ